VVEYFFMNVSTVFYVCTKKAYIGEWD
jgi:hypothetical protein